MKTVVIWDTSGSELISFFVFDKDLRKLNNKYINGNTTEDEDIEINKLMWDENGKVIANKLEEFPIDEVINGAFVIVCGYLP